MDSSADAAPVDSETIEKTESLPSQKSSLKMFPEVTRGFFSAHSSYRLINSQGKLSRRPVRNSPRAAFTGDEWIRQPTLPLLTHKQSRKTESLTTQK